MDVNMAGDISLEGEWSIGKKNKINVIYIFAIVCMYLIILCSNSFIYTINTFFMFTHHPHYYNFSFSLPSHFIVAS